jgi:polyhydroxyalkanoate synthase
MSRAVLSRSCAIQPEGSAWQGGAMHNVPSGATSNSGADLSLNGALAKLTGSISPAALSTAWFDWSVHFLLAPSKWQELTTLAVSSSARWLQYTLSATAPSADKANIIEPLAQDRRFADPGWHRWPFNAWSQGFLLQQQWWHHATSGMRGVSRHHGEVVTFTARQLLDCVAPSNFLLTNPVVQAATMHSGGLNLVGGALRAASDLSEALTRQRGTTVFTPGVNVAVTRGTVVLRNELMELLRYAPVTTEVHARPLLVVPAWIMKYYILDLSPHNSLVQYLLAQGHTVFMVSWKNPDAEDRDRSMDEYRRLGVMAALDTICAQTGADRVNACGYCLGGTLLAIAAAAMARDHDERLASITLLAAQVDFTEPGELSLFIDESEVSYLEAAMWEQGYLDTRQMAGAFQLLRSNDLIWSRRLKHYLLGHAERDSDLMAWNADATRMPYRMHSEYLRQLFLQNDLANGRYSVSGRPVALTDIEAPIFAVGTLTDHVAPWRSVYKLVLLSDTDVTFLLTSGGHNVGVVAPPDSGARSYQVATHRHDTAFIDPDRWHACVPVMQGSWWPEWANWLAERAGPMTRPPPAARGLGDAPGFYVFQR